MALAIKRVAFLAFFSIATQASASSVAELYRACDNTRCSAGVLVVGDRPGDVFSCQAVAPITNNDPIPTTTTCRREPGAGSQPTDVIARPSPYLLNMNGNFSGGYLRLRANGVHALIDFCIVSTDFARPSSYPRCSSAAGLW